MPNSVTLGEQNSVYINTGTYETPVWTEIDNVGDVTVSENRDKVEANTRASARLGYKASVAGLRDFSVKFDALVPGPAEANTGFDALETAHASGAHVDILVVKRGVISTDELKATRAICGVFGGEESEPIANATKKSFELAFVLNEHQAAPESGETLSSEFVPDGS